MPGFYGPFTLGGSSVANAQQEIRSRWPGAGNFQNYPGAGGVGTAALGFSHSGPNLFSGQPPSTLDALLASKVPIVEGIPPTGGESVTAALASGLWGGEGGLSAPGPGGVVTSGPTSTTTGPTSGTQGPTGRPSGTLESLGVTLSGGLLSSLGNLVVPGLGTFGAPAVTPQSLAASLAPGIAGLINAGRQPQSLAYSLLGYKGTAEDEPGGLSAPGSPGLAGLGLNQVSSGATTTTSTAPTTSAQEAIDAANANAPTSGGGGGDNGK